MNQQRVGAVAIAGATGLVGRACLRALLAAPEVDEVFAVGRRPAVEGEATATAHRAQDVLVDFTKFDEGPSPRVPLAAAVCALGTTIKKAGSQAAFRAVDHDAVATFARWARRHGARTFGLISSVGADPHASSFYLKVKGEVEARVASEGFDRLIVLRPSLLLGPRDESRPAEAVARSVFPLLSPFLRGRLRAYRGISAEDVGRALARSAWPGASGVHVWHYDDIVAV